MIVRLLAIFIFFGLCYAPKSVAQNSEQLFAKIIDEKTKEPVSFATIRLKGTNIGVIADYNGEFRMPYDYIKEQIIITCIGYEEKEISLKNLNIVGINKIAINPKSEALDVVVVKSKSRTYNAREIVKSRRLLTAYEIVVKAIESIPQNLSSIPHSYIGYYRDYQLVDNKYHNLNEALIETFDNGIDTPFLEDLGSKTAIYSFKQNTNFIQDTLLSEAYNGETKFIQNAEILPRGGNEYTLLNVHNPIRNYDLSTFSYVYKLEKDFPTLHHFKKDEIVYLNGEPLAVIKFVKSKHSLSGNGDFKAATNTVVLGSIYISLIDFSIHRFNYKVVLSNSKKVLFNVSLEYARKHNHMYLNYISFNNAFIAAEDYVLREEKVRFDTERNIFFISFNTRNKVLLDEKTIKPRYFKFKINNTKLRSVSARLFNNRVIEVEVARFDKEKIRADSTVATKINSTFRRATKINYTFRRVKDMEGREIYKRKSIEVNQFREFFVQNVNLNTSMTKDLNYTNINLPLQKAPINNFPDAHKYWINTPLKNN